jgi:hypothetical protein
MSRGGSGWWWWCRWAGVPPLESCSSLF